MAKKREEARETPPSDAAAALMADHLLEALSEASCEDYGEIPLPKLIELAMKLERNAVYRARMLREHERDLEEARRALLGEMAGLLGEEPEAMRVLEAASRKAARRLAGGADG